MGVRIYIVVYQVSTLLRELGLTIPVLLNRTGLSVTLNIQAAQASQT